VTSDLKSVRYSASHFSKRRLDRILCITLVCLINLFARIAEIGREELFDKGRDFIDISPLLSFQLLSIYKDNLKLKNLSQIKSRDGKKFYY